MHGRVDTEPDHVERRPAALKLGEAESAIKSHRVRVLCAHGQMCSRHAAPMHGGEPRLHKLRARASALYVRQKIDVEMCRMGLGNPTRRSRGMMDSERHPFVEGARYGGIGIARPKGWPPFPFKPFFKDECIARSHDVAGDGTRLLDDEDGLGLKRRVRGGIDIP